MDKRWIRPLAPPPDVFESLARYPSAGAQILFQRGVRTGEEAERFLSSGEPEYGDPFLLSGMAAAVDRIRAAIRDQEPIVVYGDYDADGVTATALLVGVLEGLGARVRPYIPNRFDEGYGLHAEALSALQAQGARLVVSVDCGIRSWREAEHASGLGLDLIITDHHQPGPTRPRALAVLNPRLEGDKYPFKDLAGVGLAHKLAQGLLSACSRPGSEEWLDLVAVGTVADLAPLQGENRTMVRAGLRLMNAPASSSGGDLRPGLRALAEGAGIAAGRIGAVSIAFALGPRLNAAGRLDSAETSYRLLVSRDPEEARAIAAQLSAANRQRQAMTGEMVERARALGVAPGRLPELISAIDPGFSAGIVGLAAARLMEEYYRPAIVVTVADETARGSARSIPEFSIIDALDACADLLLEFGGHAAAAGFTVRTQDLEPLLRRLSQHASAALSGKELKPRLAIDALVEFREVGRPLLEFVEALEPCGYGNPTPVLAAEDVTVVQARPVGAEGQHLRLLLRQGSVTREAIAFRKGKIAGALARRVDVAFNLERNIYMGVESLQLNVQDIRPAGQGEWARGEEAVGQSASR